MRTYRTSAAHVTYAMRSCKAAGGHCSIRLVRWVETFMVLHTRAAWECYRGMFSDAVLHDDLGAIGYGYDRCFALHCGAAHSRQGVLLNHLVWHVDHRGVYNSSRPEGRRLNIAGNHMMYQQATGQASRLERYLRALHGTNGECEQRVNSGCGSNVKRFCPIERPDLRVGQPTSDTCWHSCCCFRPAGPSWQAVPRSQWTLSDAALAAALHSRGPRHSQHVSRKQSGVS